MPSFGDWVYSLDRDATLAAYRAAEVGGSEWCDCAGCRNFLLARPKVYPPPFLALLDQLGIDPLKDGEIYHMARISPGRHAYGGWFHFVGTLDRTGNFPPVVLADGFSAWMCRASAPRLAPLEHLSVVELMFDAENIPWFLPETELE